MSSCEWERRKARTKIKKLYIPLHTLLSYEIRIVYFRHFRDLSWQFRSFKVWIQETFILLYWRCSVFLMQDFILKAFLKYRTGNETVKRLQTDTKTICFKHNHTLLLTMPSVHCASQNAIRGSSHTTDKMSQRYQFKSPRKQWLRFLLRHHSTFF